MKNSHAYRVYLTLSIASTLFNAMMFTVLTVYYVRVGALNPLQLVLVGTVMEITEFIFEIPTGLIADTYGRRLSVIIGTLITGVAFVLVAMVSTFPLFALGSVIYGLGATFLSGAREAWIVDEVGEEHIREVFLRTTQMRRLAALVGTLISAALATIAVYLPILLGASLTIALGLYLIVVMPETGFQPIRHSMHTPWRNLTHVLQQSLQLTRRQPLLLSFIAIALLFGVYGEAFDRLGDAHFLLSFTLPTWGNFDSVIWFGIISAGSQLLGFTAAAVAVRWHRTNATIPTLKLLTWLQLLWIACAAGFALAPTFVLALAAYWAVAIIGTIHGPIYDAWTNQYLESSTRATTLSMLNQANAFGQLSGGPAIGWLGTVSTLRMALCVTALALAPVIYLYQKAMRLTTRRS